ncbi:hypothetical protein H4R19_000647 [Coemansia spiralis]|nr:hypothetical protein H4R19_000647 [Coemansia spiralis]
MRQFVKTLCLDDQRSVARGFRESELMLEDLAHAKENLDKLTEMWAQILIAENVGEKFNGPGGPLSIKVVEAEMTQTRIDIAKLEDKVKEDCTAMARIMAEHNFKVE